MGSGSITSAMQTNVQLMEIQIRLVHALTQLQVLCISCIRHLACVFQPVLAGICNLAVILTAKSHLVVYNISACSIYAWQAPAFNYAGSNVSLLHCSDALSCAFGCCKVCYCSC